MCTVAIIQNLLQPLLGQVWRRALTGGLALLAASSWSAALATPPETAEETAESIEVVTPPPARLSVTQLRQKHRELLAAGSPKPDLVWLKVAEREVMAGWQPDTSGNALGAVLILPASDQDPITPAYLRNLHSHLHAHGWATLSLELPLPPALTIPPRKEPPAKAPASGPKAQQEDEASEAIDETQVIYTDLVEEAPTVEPEPEVAPLPKLTLEELEQILTADIQAGVNYLHEQGHYNIALLGIGQGAAHALAFIAHSEGIPQPDAPNGASSGAADRLIQAVVLIQPTTTLWPQMPSLHELLTHPDIPVLDLYLNDRGLATQDAHLRRQQSRAGSYENYVQRGLSAPPGITAGEDRVTKTVRGFLTRYAQGTELN